MHGRATIIRTAGAIIRKRPDIVTAADDTLVAISLGSGNWFVAEYNFNVAANERSALGFIPQYISPNQTITLNSSITLAHGLGAVPDEIELYLVCTTAELGYAANNRVPAYQFVGSFNGVGATVVADATNLYVLSGADVIVVMNRSTRQQANITPASWRLVAAARRNL